MRKFFNRCLRRLLPLGLAASAAAVLLAPGIAQATPYVLKVLHQGNNVVATGNGAFDLTSLTLQGTTPSYGPYFYAAGGQIVLSSSTSKVVNIFTGLIGPQSFGTGVSPNASSFSGDSLELYGAGGTIDLPTGYATGTMLSSVATWDNSTIASLGLTPGTYVWTWGTGADQSFTLDIGSDASVGVPEPGLARHVRPRRPAAWRVRGAAPAHGLSRPFKPIGT
ncbi:MAG: hypothetical protein ABI389_03335 [Rhodanobacter sp.]